MFGNGFLFAGYIIKFKEPYLLTQIVNLLFATLTGTYYPVTLLPYWVQFLSGVLPQTYVIDDMRRIVLANQTLESLYASVFFFFGLGVTLFAPTTSRTPQESGGFSFFLLGFVFIILFSTAVWGIGQTVRNEQTAGTLEQFFLA